VGHRCFLFASGGILSAVNIRKLIEERIRHSAGGVDVDSDVHAVVAANVGERGAVTSVSSTQRSSAGSTSSRRERDEEE
jgi:hypothetical protein